MAEAYVSLPHALVHLPAAERARAHSPLPHRYRHVHLLGHPQCVFIILSLSLASTVSADLSTNFSDLPLPFAEPSSASKLFPKSLREPTLELASSHLVCSVVLTGVLALQAGRWWAEQADIDEDDEEIDDAADTGAETDRTEPERDSGVRRRDVKARA